MRAAEQIYTDRLKTACRADGQDSGLNLCVCVCVFIFEEFILQGSVSVCSGGRLSAECACLKIGSQCTRINVFFFFKKLLFAPFGLFF